VVSLPAGNLEAENIRSRAESTGWCVKLKTVTEIRRSRACGVYLVLNSLWDWEAVERLTERSLGRFYVLFFQYEVGSTVLYATKARQKGENCSSRGVTE